MSQAGELVPRLVLLFANLHLIKNFIYIILHAI